MTSFCLISGGFLRDQLRFPPATASFTASRLPNSNRASRVMFRLAVASSIMRWVIEPCSRSILSWMLSRSIYSQERQPKYVAIKTMLIFGNCLSWAWPMVALSRTFNVTAPNARAGLFHGIVNNQTIIGIANNYRRHFSRRASINSAPIGTCGCRVSGDFGT